MDDGTNGVPAAVLTARRKPYQKAAEILNEGWQKFKDPESGYFYYWHEETQESSYDRPANFDTNANPFVSIMGTNKSMVPAQLLTARRKETQQPVERLNGGWCKYYDEGR